MVSITRRTAGIITAALALGTAAPASARPFNQNANGSFVPAGPLHLAPPNIPAAASHVTSGGGISELGYIGIGTGGAVVVLISAGGALAASRRRHQPSATRHSTSVA